MTQAKCTGKVIGTQMYSYETGRCMLAGGEVTIAVFDTAHLRDEWASGCAELGGTIVEGDGWWAAWIMHLDTAAVLADALHGQVVIPAGS